MHSAALHPEGDPQRHLALPGAEFEARLRVARGVDAAVELARQRQVHQHVGRRALHAHCGDNNFEVRISSKEEEAKFATTTVSTGKPTSNLWSTSTRTTLI